MFQFGCYRRRPGAFCRASLYLIPGCLIVSVLATGVAVYGKPASRVLAGRRAFVSDERLSALRARPEMSAKLIQRLRRGRAVGVIGVAQTNDGNRFFRVIVTRRTTGWVLAASVTRSGVESDGEKLIQLIEEEKDVFVRAKLAAVCAVEFRNTRIAPRALLLLGESADQAADQVMRLAERRVRNHPNRDLLMLNDVALDRYNRIGIRFRIDAEGRLRHDGQAYREILRRYPRSAEASVAIERLGAR